MANMGLPLFSGFVGEFFIITSIVSINEIMALLISVGFLFSGIYNLFQLNRLLFSDSQQSISNKSNEDLDSNSTIVLTALLF
jgi:NADH:ubiquinone oxidoreductase subunit 4 (subunit M)